MHLEESGGGGGGDTGAGPRLVTHTLRLGYEALSAEEALRRILPPHVTVPTGFETAGHIAHLNLRAEVGRCKLKPLDILVDTG